MTWHRGKGSAVPEGDPDRINRLTCDGNVGYTGDLQPIPCSEKITGVLTAETARQRARQAGWETVRPTGDRCPQHRITRRRRYLG